jgi:serine/threonine protein kinase
MSLDTSKTPALSTLGDYDVLAKIAEGGMGTIYKGRHRKTGLIVAIKVIPPATAKNEVLLKRFKQEFHAASVLDHPNIVRALEYNESGPSPFLVMEFVDGISLGQRIERDGPISEAESIRILAQVCQGLHRAHKQGLIHRDVKPDNIMITRDGVAKLTDMGLVKDVENELNLTRTGRGLGTPHFMAPEQFRNAKNADVRCDIYSLGATLYMMVTGQMPFSGCGPLDAWLKKAKNDFVPPKQLKPDLSDRIDWAIRRAMSGDPDVRPSSCREFVEDLMGHSIRSSQDAPTSDLWYLIYQDGDGQTHTVKGGMENIRKAIREEMLGNPHRIRASRTKQGEFVPLRELPEFRDLVIVPAPAPTNTQTPARPQAPPASGVMRAPGAASGAWTRSQPVPNAVPMAEPADDAIDFNAPLNLHGGSASRILRSGRIVPNTGETSGRLPHINLKSDEEAPAASRGSDSLIWVMVLVVAVITAFLAYFLLTRMRG